MLQSISEWLSKMANRKWRDVAIGKWRKVIHATPTRLTLYRMLLVRNGVVLEPHNDVTHLPIRHAICDLPFWTTILKSTVDVAVYS